MDSYILNQSINSSNPAKLIDERKNWVPINDSNGLSYTSNKVTFNLDSFNSGSDYFSASESYIQIPLNIAVNFAGTSTIMLTSATSVENNFIASLKNGSYNIIDKINYKLAGNEIITLDNFENCKIHYDILTSWSQDNVVKRGDELYFGLDDVSSTYVNTLLGVCNNRIRNTGVFTGGLSTMANSGRLNRMKKTSYNSLSTSTIMPNNEDLVSRRTDYCAMTANSGSNHTMNYFILASFRLSDLHPFFKNLPLIKNPSQYLSLTLNTNAIHTVTMVAGAITAVSLSNQTNTCPYQLTEFGNAVATGCNLTNTAAGVITSQINVVQAKGIVGSVPHAVTQCIFNACFVKLNTDAYELYSNPSTAIKMVNWNECYCQSGGGLSGVITGGQVNQLISGSFMKLRRIVVLPFLAGSTVAVAGYGTLANGVLSPILSPFASEPSTLSAYVGNGAMNNFQVRLGINNVFQSNIQFSYENYLQYFKSQNAINGGISNGISSGLISQSQWEQGYGYRVVDLTVKNKANDLAGEQITVQMLNSSGRTMDYIVLVYYEKNILLDTERGLVMQSV